METGVYWTVIAGTALLEQKEENCRLPPFCGKLFFPSSLSLILQSLSSVLFRLSIT